MAEQLLFDRPVEAYLADDNALKWLYSAIERNRLAPDASWQSASTDVRRQLHQAIESAFQSWDPNRGQEHEDAIRNDLEKKLNSISVTALARLSEEQLSLVRTEQKSRLGYAYIFAAKPSELGLDQGHQAQLVALSLRAVELAIETTRKDMDRIQIRNPQAYIAYKFCKLYEETRKSRSELGKEFVKKLSPQEREQLQLATEDLKP